MAISCFYDILKGGYPTNVHTMSGSVPPGLRSTMGTGEAILAWQKWRKLTD
jgi:hypothetical protein